MPFNADLATGHNTYLLGHNHQTFHALRGMAKKLFNGISKGVYTNIGGVFEYFIRLSHYYRAARVLRALRGLSHVLL
ncbi:hypothetical protein KDAU_01130 [Dictyobacter aurantiacus]|uniref:Uncharacterized protein n=1 Tax=Dictyobacter aurantiacus TaxID=1936993 RepID=A0A401Z7G2_9CHLR|nr:hypothetical protein KDAU_01130 [Dictyobacter aurantiacus]